MNGQTRNTRLFIAFTLAAGTANVLSRTGIPAFDAFMTALNYTILTGLLLFWIRSVRVRLLPSGARRSVLWAGILMLLYMLIRIYKYRFALGPAAMRYAVYAYWVPQMLISSLFIILIQILQPGEKYRLCTGASNQPSFLPIFTYLHICVQITMTELRQYLFLSKNLPLIH